MKAVSQGLRRLCAGERSAAGFLRAVRFVAAKIFGAAFGEFSVEQQPVADVAARRPCSAGGGRPDAQYQASHGRRPLSLPLSRHALVGYGVHVLDRPVELTAAVAGLWIFGALT